MVAFHVSFREVLVGKIPLRRELISKIEKDAHLETMKIMERWLVLWNFRSETGMQVCF